jgi:hypothetical protein
MQDHAFDCISTNVTWRRCASRSLLLENDFVNYIKPLETTISDVVVSHVTSTCPNRIEFTVPIDSETRRETHASEFQFCWKFNRLRGQLPLPQRSSSLIIQLHQSTHRD